MQKIKFNLGGNWGPRPFDTHCDLRIAGKVLAIATDIGSVFVFVKDAGGQALYTYHGKITLWGEIREATQPFFLSLDVRGPLLALGVGDIIRLWDLESGRSSGCWGIEGDNEFECFSSLLWKEDASCLIAVDNLHRIHTWRIDMLEGTDCNDHGSDCDGELTIEVDSHLGREDPKDWLGWRQAIDSVLREHRAMSWRDLQTGLIRRYKMAHGDGDGFYSDEYIGCCALTRVPRQYLSKADQYVRLLA